MEVTNKDWNSFREALIVWSNKLKPGSAKPWFSAREAVIALSKIDWSKIGKNVSGSEIGGADESKLFTIVYTNESESEIDYIKSKYVLVSDVLKVPDYLYIPDGKEIPEHALSLNSLTISGETPTGIYDGVTSLFELNDVEIDSLTLSQYDGLYYDLESSIWRNGKSFIVTWGGLTQTVSGDKQFEIIHVNESLYIPDGNNLSQHKIDLTSETITGETPTGVYDNITTLAELNDVELNASTLSQYDGLYYDLETTTWYNGKAFVNTWGGLTQEISGDKQFETIHVRDNLYIPDGTNLSHHKLSLTNTTIISETPTGIGNSGNDTLSLFELLDVSIDLLGLNNYDGLYYDITESVWKAGKPFLVICDNSTQEIDGDKRFDVIRAKDKLYIPDGLPVSIHNISFTNQSIVGETPTGIGVGSTVEGVSFLHLLEDVSVDFSTISNYAGLYYDTVNSLWKSGNIFLITEGSISQTVNGNKTFDYIKVNGSLYIPDATTNSTHRISVTTTEITGETPTGSGGEGGALFLTELLDIDSNNSYGADYLLYWNTNTSLWNTKDVFQLIGYRPLNEVIYTNWIGTNVTQKLTGDITGTETYSRNETDISISTTLTRDFIYLGDNDEAHKFTLGSTYEEIKDMSLLSSATIRANSNLYIPDGLTSSQHKISVTTTEITGETPTGSGGEGGALFLTELLDIDSNNSYGADYLLCWNTNTSLWNTKDVFQLIGYTPLDAVTYNTWIDTDITQEFTGDITGTKTYSRDDTDISISTALTRDFIYLGANDANHKFTLSNSDIYREIKDMSLLSSATIRANSNLYIPDGLTSSQHKISVTSTLVEGETPTAGIIVEDPSSPESSVNGWTDVYEPAGGISLGNYVVAKVDDNFNTSGALFIIDAVGSTPENSGTIIFFCSSKGSAETQNTITVLGNSMPTDPTINKLMIERKSPYRYLKIYLKSGITKLVINCVNNNGWTTMDSYSPVSGAILSYTMNITSDSIISKRFTTT